MNFKLVSKENMGGVLFLLLVIIVSQSHVFDFLFYTALGRALFITFLLIIGYLNKILGVVTVLLMILMINNRENNYLEGFDVKNTNIAPDISGNSISDVSTKVQELKNSIAQTNNTSSSSLSNTATNTELNKPILQEIHKKINQTNTETTNSTTPSSTATEGFDVLGTENNLKRGKRSNTIPVNHGSRKSGNVDPYYKSSFADSYSLF